jgi:hypothetical protein
MIGVRSRWHAGLMPRRTGIVGAPNAYLRANGIWPDGPFRKATPPSVMYAAEISRRLKDAIDKAGGNISAIAGDLGVARSTLYDILRGTTFPDLHTLAGAERYFGVRLWPTD